ncbi:MAG: choice-of-anchor D domain-containing protein [Acidobacteria bacterium]|nr:choice-of-anchor D domain-containing protein [Acidobacteriota bacterium]
MKWRKQVLVSSLTCANQSITGAGTTTCTVHLSSAAPSGGTAVTLSSGNPAVMVPSLITVQGGGTTASFLATVASVNTAQTANLTASANGSSARFGIQLNAYVPALTISSATVSFGAVNVGQTATKMVTLSSSGSAPLTLSSISVAGSLFKATGVSAPLTLNPGQSVGLTLQFYSDHTSSYTGVVTISSNSTQGSATINMTADGVPSVSGLTCNTQAFTGQGTDSCLVSLYGAAPYNGFTVYLASNNSSVSVPASVTVAPGAMSASFSASVNAVSSSQTATLTATASGTSKSFVLQLGPGSAMLAANASSVPFGNVLINSPAEQSITLTSSGNSPVTINSLAINGNGFAVSGLSTPVVLSPGQSAVLNVQFTPSAAGNFSGQITIGSTSSGGTITIGLSGTGYGHNVQLSWNAPSSGSTPVVGYNIYRVTTGNTGYQKLNSTVVSTTAYIDTSVQSGSPYTYYVTSVDGSGAESAPSNTAVVTLPTP